MTRSASHSAAVLTISRSGRPSLCSVSVSPNWREISRRPSPRISSAEAVSACEKAPSSTPFKWNNGKSTSIVGLNSVKLDKYTVIASFTLVADNVYCDYDPIKHKANIGNNFLEREDF